MGQNGSMPMAGSGAGGYGPGSMDQQGGVMQVMAEHPSGHKGRAFMGAQDALRAMNTEFVPPTATSIVKATENAPEMGPRGLAISAALYNHNPELIQWQLVLGAVRRGVSINVSWKNTLRWLTL